jgi:integrase
VQQELLRHADIRTTLNVYTQAVYTQAMSDQKRQAHSKIVRSVLRNRANWGAAELIAPSAPLTS